MAVGRYGDGSWVRVGCFGGVSGFVISGFIGDSASSFVGLGVGFFIY